MRTSLSLISIAFVIVITTAKVGHADAMKAAAVGCTTPADAEKIVALQVRHDKAGTDALARSLVASRACIDFAKGVTIEVDERRAPLTCVRLTGDLSCYWIAAALVDEHPAEKGGGGKGGGGRHGGARAH